MNYLFPIHCNKIGCAYVVKSSLDDSIKSKKIQLKLDEVVITFSKKELNDFLKLINTSKKEFKSIECKQSQLKVIKFETMHMEIILKITKKNITAFEDLIRGALFKFEIEFILNTNDIK